MRRFRILLLGILMTSLAVMISAQDNTCPAIVAFALEETDQVCDQTGRNQVCHGHGSIDLQVYSDAQGVRFTLPGDVAELSTVQSMQLSPMNQSQGLWGVALMRLQANIPDTLPGQLVSVLLFGDVNFYTNRPNPNTQEAPVSKLQAFYFHTGIGDSQCDEAPNSGLLVQTPEGVSEVQFMLNSVEFTLGSTAFLQALPGGEMRINLLDGSATIRAFGQERIMRGSMRVRVPIDNNLQPVGPPTPVEKCATNDLSGIPYERWNCEAIQIVLDPRYCAGSIDIPYDMDITLHIGSGYPTEDEAQSHLQEGETSISINGTEVDVYRFGPYRADELWAFGTNHDWGKPEPGTYFVTGVEPNASRSCAVNIVMPADGP